MTVKLWAQEHLEGAETRRWQAGVLMETLPGAGNKQAAAEASVAPA